MTRSPAVADRFYPGGKNRLKKTVTDLLIKYKPVKRHGALAVVSPHAGYIYSGDACAETLQSIDIPETVIILGPNHHGRGAPIAMSKVDWDMPLGRVPINTLLANHILDISSIATIDESAHQFEHSLEVQVPFLQILQEDLSIVPLALSHLTYSQCEELATNLAEAVKIYNKPVLILASSDMSHYESRESAEKKDKMALANLIALNPSGLYHTVTENRISMCGVIPVSVALQAALLLGANSAEVIKYTDSGVVSGDTGQVVGYAGAVICKT